jgi:ABC-2 type transport system ATP-binding protein
MGSRPARTRDSRDRSPSRDRLGRRLAGHSARYRDRGKRPAAAAFSAGMRSCEDRRDASRSVASEFRAPARIPMPSNDSTAAAAVLAVRGLAKRYAATVAVDGVSFEVQRNEIVGLLGPNGAGKTTTLNMIMGVLEPSAGSIAIEGIDIATDRAGALARTNFAAVYAPLPGNLTVRQNLTWFGLLYDVPDLRERIGKMLALFDLERLVDTKCGVLSSGEQTRVCLAKAMLNEPTLLLLDEPTASLDPATARELREVIRGIAGRGNGGILWTSHNMYEVEDVCDRVLFLSRGKILLEGDPRALPGQHGAGSLEELFIQLAREPLHAEAPR